MTKSYYYGQVEKPKPKKTIKKKTNSWSSEEWANYEHQKHLNKLADEKIQNLYYDTMEKINNTHGEIVDKIVQLHKESKTKSAFDEYEEDNQ